MGFAGPWGSEEDDVLAAGNEVQGPQVRDLIADRREVDVRRALLATRRARPDDPLAFFRASLGRAVPRQPAEPAGAPPVVSQLQSVEDPYGP